MALCLHFTKLVLINFIFLILISIMVSSSMADSAKDREECTEQLTGLATCLPYVGGQAKSPTPDCCSGLKQLLKSNKKCLCVIIRDRDDPDLGLKINVTLALGLPSVCHAPANVSQCPALLHLDPNSPEAQVFYQLAKGSNHTASSPSPSPSTGNSASANSTGTSTAQEKSDGCCYRKRWLGLEIVAAGVYFGILLVYNIETVD